MTEQGTRVHCTKINMHGKSHAAVHIFKLKECCIVVSAGWQLTISAFSPAEVQFDIAEREQ